MAFFDFLEKLFWGYSKKEFNEYLEAAEQGDKNAQFQLGVIYSKDGVVKKNYEESIKWYTLAAEQGHALAINNLGHVYLSGLGVNRNERKAVELFKKAADLGESTAQYNLGFCFENGKGVKKDEKEAEAWYRKSAEQGNVKAKERVEIIDRLQALEKERKEREIGDKQRYGFTRDELVVEDVWTGGENNPKHMEYMLAVMSQRGYDAVVKRDRERSIREIELEPGMVEGLEKQDAVLAADISLNANSKTGYFFQQCGDIYINPKFITITNIGVHMIKTSDVFAVSYDLVRSNNPRKAKYLLVFYTYNKLLPCFATEIVVGIGTKQYDYFGVDGVEKYIPYLNLKYPIKPFINMRYYLGEDKAFINLFRHGQLEDEVYPAIEWQKGMFEPGLFPRSTVLHKEAISVHFKRGYKPEKTIILGGDD